MAGLWQRTGNVTVTNGSKTVTGFGTKWKTGVLPIQKGHAFYGPDGVANEVDNVVSDTEILLVEAYRGGTLANQPYKIDITRTSTISQFAADLASLVGKYRAWFDGMMTWLTGSGDVSILNPDTGATTTLPSWKKVASEGEGQAARAKAEADKAASSAALAGGIVEASALPLPDVWAPLSDSLRLITGYGRDVLVGTDVVARMVNFARSTTATYIGKDGLLKTAAANEPRFEKEGLLIEGQVANLWYVQSAASLNIANAEQEPVTLPTGVSGNAYKVVPSSAAFSHVRVTLSQQTGQHTLSCFARKADGSDGMPTLYSGHSGQLLFKTSGVYVGNGWWRMYVALTDPTGNTGFGFAPTTIDPIPVHICFFQLEALPFASSYIPTNGAVVTRAADVATIPQARNIPDLLGSSYSIAARFTLKPGVSKNFRFLFRTGNVLTESMGIVQTNSAAKLRAYQGTADLGNNVVLLPFVEGSSFVCGLCIRSGTVVGYSSVDRAVVASPSRFTPNSKMADFLLGDLRLMANYQPNNEAWGHIRDLRIWWQALSDAQWKVVS
ncbi:hypothetical protein ACK32E_07535 [Aeromonas caviae]